MECSDLAVLIRTIYGIIVGFIFAIISKIFNVPKDPQLSLICILALLILYIPTLPLTNYVCLTKFGTKPKSRDILAYVATSFASWIAFYNFI